MRKKPLTMKQYKILFSYLMDPNSQRVSREFEMNPRTASRRINEWLEKMYEFEGWPDANIKADILIHKDALKKHVLMKMRQVAGTRGGMATSRRSTREKRDRKLRERGMI